MILLTEDSGFLMCIYWHYGPLKQNPWL